MDLIDPYTDVKGFDHLDSGSELPNDVYGYAAITNLYYPNYSGYNESKYGLTPGSGQWAMEFPYGTVYGVARVSETSPSDYSENPDPVTEYMEIYTSTTDPVVNQYPDYNTYCWCKITGFSSYRSDYSSGPACTITASSKWLYVDVSHTGYPDECPRSCSQYGFVAGYKRWLFYQKLWQ